jgi:hypothetical protein
MQCNVLNPSDYCYMLYYRVNILIKHISEQGPEENIWNIKVGTEKWKMRHNEDLYDFYSSPNIVIAVK